MNHRRNLKYPLYLFIAILVAKIGYIVIESYYNYYVLTVTTNASLTKETIEELNVTGHRLSALGFTLLLIPFLYFLSKKYLAKYKYFSFASSSVIVYFLALSGLNLMIDTIVDNNKDKRHDAYYVNVFKYGILNSLFVYDSFIDSEKIRNNTLDVNDRILLTNTFLLLHADDELIEKLKKRGREEVASLYLDYHAKEDFEVKDNAFKKASKKISLLWNTLHDNKLKLKNKLSKLGDKEMEDGYQLLLSGLDKGYKDYLSLQAKIAGETSKKKLKKYKKDLKRYFKYRKYKTVQRRYDKAMDKHFGRSVDPSVWLDSNGNVSTDQIKSVITNEILSAVDSKIKNLPSGLSFDEFKNHYEIKLIVMQRLKENDILVPYEFDYSHEQFVQYFKAMSSKKREQAYNFFYTKLEDKIGKNDIELRMNYEEFVHSNYIKKQITKSLDTVDEVTTKRILNALISKDLASFRNMVYLEGINDKVQPMVYEKKDFMDKQLACRAGDDAIKLLYIPPFALSISIIALLLNIVTVFAMLLALVTDNKIITRSVRVGLLIMILMTPVYYKEKSVNNNLLNQSTTEAKTYLNFLAWISFYEKANSSIHEK